MQPSDACTCSRGRPEIVGDHLLVRANDEKRNREGDWMAIFGIRPMVDILLTLLPICEALLRVCALRCAISASLWARR